MEDKMLNLKKGKLIKELRLSLLCFQTNFKFLKQLSNCKVFIF